MQLGLGISPTQPYGVSVPAFTPASISGLQLWLDASDASTLFTDSAGTTAASADGDPVGCWKDKSGNGKNATQTDGTKKPIKKIAVKNSRDVIRWDGANDALTINNSQSVFSFLWNTQGTIFFVFQPTVLRNCAIIDSSTLTSQNGIFIGIWNSKIESDGGKAFDLSFNTVSQTINNNTWYSVTNRLNGQDLNLANRSRLFVNNTANSVLNTKSATWTGDSFGPISFGNSLGVSGYEFDGNIAEIMIYNSSLSDSNKALVENYLNAKWSIY